MVDKALYSIMRERLRHTPMSFHRYLYSSIPLDARLLGIIGPRGVGKSTMVLQILKANNEKSLYVDADNIYFSTNSLIELADNFVKEDGKLLAIDEIHKYQGWSKELKQIHDNHPSLKVIFTGSSVLDIKKGEADLSRRAILYNLQGLSFREYLELFHGIQLPVFSLDDILSHNVDFEIPEHPLPYFKDYLKKGYFPFSNEPGFEIWLNQIISQTVENDIPLFANLMTSTARKLKQLLGLLAHLAPYKPSIEKLAQEIGVSKNNLPEYLNMLEKAGMISLLRDDTAGLRTLGKVEKLFIDNTNMMYAMAGIETNIGNVRETFFQNQMRLTGKLSVSRTADFKIGGFTFEIGGKNKGQKQIAKTPDSFIVKDDIEYGSNNIIPLYHFGLTY
ncbi:MAG: AAA family ATPase [Muribaculaceae bacterium]|nr:AAA family ATPase [Muribaculaceae bacterium]